MGAHIREFRKVTAAVPCSREPPVGLAERPSSPGVREVWMSGWMLLWGALLQRAVVQSGTE